MELLDDSKKRLRIFSEGIKINNDLPKYHVEGEEKEEDEQSYNTLNNIFSNEEITQKDLMIKISDSMKKIIKTSNEFNSISSRNRLNRFVLDMNTTKPYQNKESSWIERIMSKFGWRKYKDSTTEEDEELGTHFDVYKFFDDVKLEGEKEKEGYKNRVKEYLSMIGTAEKSGQISLKEKLFIHLVINKYESLLYANGIYKAVSEESIVKFAKGCPKALSIDYIANYVRSIPIPVIKVKEEIDKLEIFDNYCILHYDIDGNGSDKTNKEKEEEVAKAKDPILFGLIVGSNKLYYITDWVDEYCDLTFDTLVDVLGKEVIESGFLTDKIED